MTFGVYGVSFGPFGFEATANRYSFLKGLITKKTPGKLWGLFRANYLEHFRERGYNSPVLFNYAELTIMPLENGSLEKTIGLLREPSISGYCSIHVGLFRIFG